MIDFIRNLKLARKFLAVSVLLAMSFVLIAMTYLSVLNSERSTLIQDRRVSEFGRLIDQISIGLLEARRREKDFLLDNRTVHLTEHLKVMDSTFKSIDGAKLLVPDQSGTELLNDVLDLLTRYKASFKKVEEAKLKIGLAENNGLRGNLLKASGDVESVLKEHQNLEALNSLLLMNKLEKEFVARRDPRCVRKMAEERERFDTLTRDADVEDELRRRIASDMDAYHESFLEVVEGLNQVNSTTESVRSLVDSLDPKLAALQDERDRWMTANEERGVVKRFWITGFFMTALVVLGVGVSLIFLWLSRLITRPLDTAVKVATSISQGNLKNKITATSRDETGLLLEALDAMQQKLIDVISNIKSSAETVSAGALQVSEGSTNLSQRTEETASTLQETAASMQEMTATVTQNTENARQARDLSVATHELADKGGEVVRRTVGAIEEINTSSKKIADIIGVIEALSFQTNLLALNAAVEAARAGDQGRGFAVVASEVRKLAQRSSTSAKEIKDLIQDSTSKVEIGTQLVTQSGDMLEEIVDSVKKLSNNVSEIAAVSEEQSLGIVQVDKAITQMDSMTQQNGAMVEEAASASMSMREEARQLKELMMFFDLGDARISSQGSATARPHRVQDSAWRTWHEPAGGGHATRTRRKEPDTVTVGASDDDEWEQF